MSHAIAINIVICNLEGEVRAGLEGSLRQCGAPVHIVFSDSVRSCSRTIGDGSQYTICCKAEPDELTTLRQACPRAIIIAVGLHGSEAKWLEAIEAGADDYYALPLEREQLEWLLASARRALSNDPLPVVHARP